MQITKRASKREVFSELYDEFMPKVFRYIHYKVNHQQTTEDLTSMVFEKALVSFDKYSSEKAAFSTWIFSIARNTLIDYYRTNKMRQQASLDEAVEVPSREPSPFHRTVLYLQPSRGGGGMKLRNLVGPGRWGGDCTMVSAIY